MRLIYTDTSMQAGCNTMSVFKPSSKGLNLVPFFLTSYHTNAKKVCPIYPNLGDKTVHTFFKGA